MMGHRRRPASGLACLLAVLASGCAGLVGADFDDKVLCDKNCPSDQTGGGPLNPPIELATGQGYPVDVAVDSENVYWANSDTPGGGEIVKCAIRGCSNTPTTLATKQIDPESIAVDASAIYWVNGGGTVMSCASAGCANSPMTLATDLASPDSDIAVDATNVYWTYHGGLSEPSQILKCAKGGCNGMPSVIAESDRAPSAVAVDAKNVYWIAIDRLMKCGIEDCANQPTVLAIEPGLRDLAVDDTNVYFLSKSSNGSGQLMACAVGGCETKPTVLAMGLNDPKAIAVDHGTVFWAEGYGNDISACATAACTARKIAIDLVQPNAVAADASNVYFPLKSGSFGIIASVAR